MDLLTDSCISSQVALPRLLGNFSDVTEVLLNQADLFAAAALRKLLKHAWLGHLRTLGTGFAAPHGHP